MTFKSQRYKWSTICKNCYSSDTEYISIQIIYDNKYCILDIFSNKIWTSILSCLFWVVGSNEGGDAYFYNAY